MRLIAFSNSYTKGVSGGDIRFIEIAKRMKDVNKLVITSQLGSLLCQKKGLDADYIITTNETEIKSVILLYLKRIFKTFLLDLDLYFDTEKNVVVYSTSDFLPDVLPAFWLKLGNIHIKWIAIVHSIAPNPFYDHMQEFSKKKKRKLLSTNELLYKIFQLASIKLMTWGADKILVVNTEIRDYLIKKNIDTNKIIIVDNGVDFVRIQKIKPHENIKYDATFIGRYHRHKGIFDLIKIWKLVCAHNDNAKLAIIGDGSEEFRSKVEYEIKKINLDKNIDLLGFLSWDDTIKVIKSSKIFVCPSFYESWSIVITEAMACKLPVIAYDLSIYKSIYENNILKIPIGDINQFADIILKVLNDSQMMKYIGGKGEKFIQKYDWDKICKREIEILMSI